MQTVFSLIGPLVAFSFGSQFGELLLLNVLNTNSNR